MTWLEGICDSVMVKMELAAVAVEMSVPQILKAALELHESACCCGCWG